MDLKNPKCGDLVRARAPIPYTDSFGRSGTITAMTWGGLVQESLPGTWWMTFWGHAVIKVPLELVTIVPEEECPPPYWEMHSQEEGWVPPRSRA